MMKWLLAVMAVAFGVGAFLLRPAPVKPVGAAFPIATEALELWEAVPVDDRAPMHGLGRDVAYRLCDLAAEGATPRQALAAYRDAKDVDRRVQSMPSPLHEQYAAASEEIVRVALLIREGVAE